MTRVEMGKIMDRQRSAEGLLNYSQLRRNSDKQPYGLEPFWIEELKILKPIIKNEYPKLLGRLLSNARKDYFKILS